ncbi:hypothetical protein PsYK624_151120 [Phanerochaete sordida]|uniref:Uncharacterized protein n=1 Tax=Phanerochaete sordida TaxID=48140 RepID=A0A9P3LKZ8_9APHY|nr:hypothetical protein PsYK624_151120 [Phanerochaete sordida]
MCRQHALFPMKDLFAELAKRPPLDRLSVASLEPSDGDGKCQRQDPSFVDPEDVVFLAGLPRINTLDCYLQSTSDWTSLSSQLLAIPFKNLRHLKLYGGMVKRNDTYYKADGDATVRSLTLFLQALRPACPLEDMDIRVLKAAAVTTPVLQDLFSAIGAFHASLDACFLEIDAPSSVDTPPVTMDALTPLLPVRMHGLALSHTAVDLGTADVHALAEAWGAALRWLLLGQRAARTVPRVPLGALPELFGALWQIQELGLRVHDDAPTYPGQCCGRSEELDLGYSALEPANFARAAEFLVDTCPCYSMRLADPRDKAVGVLWERAVDKAENGQWERARAREEARRE